MLISIYNAYLSFNDLPILENVDFHLKENERICLVGRNGVGKSTFLKILNKKQSLDSGKIFFRKNIITSYLSQNIPNFSKKHTIYDFFIKKIKKEIEYLEKYNKISNLLTINPSKKNFNEIEKLQNIIEEKKLWLLENRVKNLLQEINIEKNLKLTSLSGGLIRKVALVRLLINKPNVIFLDEPTNHLDIRTIQWLENFLKKFQGSILFISHDRAFIRKIATKILDLDRGKITSWSNNYDEYILKKNELIDIENIKNSKFDEKLIKEEIWIKKSLKARRRRNEGRVRNLIKLRKKRLERKKLLQYTSLKEKIEINLSGKVIYDIKNLSFFISKKCIIKNFSLSIHRGDKIALIGSNGSGKTTFIKLLLNKIKNFDGSIQIGNNLKIGYFEQSNFIINSHESLIDNFSDGKKEITINKKTYHATHYLKKFLFESKNFFKPVSALSGGERNRLTLCKLFLQPNNVLILDEPTNNLDIETLELLEELINNYQGTVLLISHDREFIDNTMTDCLFFNEDGIIQHYIGGYHDI